MKTPETKQLHKGHIWTRKELFLNKEKETAWLNKLSEFIVEANTKTWAADASEVEAERSGYQELEYQRDDWRLRDSYAGYFRAPGMTTIYYKNMPVWTMAYGGTGMNEEWSDTAKETFTFLKKALMNVDKSMPFRGPERYEDNDMSYTFEVEGDITDFRGKEEIKRYFPVYSVQTVFTQNIIGGIIIGKDDNEKPLYPWNL